MNRDRLLAIYLSTIYTANAPASIGNTANTFSNVTNDYCRDLEKLEHYLDIIFLDEKKYYKNFNRIKITGGELGDLDDEYILKLYKLLEKYNDITVSKDFDNKKISICTNGNIFKKIPFKTIEEYKINTVYVFDMNTYPSEFYKSKIQSNDNRNNFLMTENKNILSSNKNKKFCSYTFMLNDLSDEFFYKKFIDGDFIDVRCYPSINCSSLFAEHEFTFNKSKFCPSIIQEESFDRDSCAKYSYRFGIDLVNDTIFKCNCTYDISPKIELTDENFKKALGYDIEYFIPNYDNNDICNQCVDYKYNRRLLSYNFKNKSKR